MSEQTGENEEKKAIELIENYQIKTKKKGMSFAGIHTNTYTYIYHYLYTFSLILHSSIYYLAEAQRRTTTTTIITPTATQTKKREERCENRLDDCFYLQAAI